MTLAEAKDHLRVDHADEDQLINGLINYAVANIDGPNGIGIAMMPQTWTMVADVFGWCMTLPIVPAISVDEIRYIDAAGAQQVLASSEYQVDTFSSPARLMPAYGVSWPTTRSVMNAVQVDFTVGYSAIPADIRAALLLLIGHLYENREAVVIGTISTPLPFGVDSILERYRVGRVS